METNEDHASDDTLAMLLDGDLPEARRQALLAHLNACEACCDLVARAMRDPWEPPPELDEFRIERLLGQGSMGTVYLAWDRSLSRRVALKFIAWEDPERRALLENEARLMARLHHPNVVTVFRVGQAGERPYIASEYVEGQGLFELAGKLPWRRVVTLALGLSRGLQAAHAQGVLHRDIKPSNIIVTRDDQVKLLDFGLAVPYGPAADGAPRKAGTPLYMAPELFQRAPPSTRSDLYSLGLVLAELLTGRPPAGGRTRAPDEFVAGLEPGAGADPDLVELIARCLDPDPARRPASAEALAEALQRLENALPSAAESPPGNPYRGLAPFEAEHQTVFLGRGDDIRAVAERLSRQPVVLLAGDSGVGKSSLCRAGVLPFLSAQARAGGRPLTCASACPGRRPFHALALALAPYLGRREDELARALEETPAAAAREIREASAGDRGGLLLLVDQLEELITLAEPAHAARCATFLAELALPASGVRLLLAVRGDYMTRVGALPRLGDEVQGAFHLLRHMTPEGLREAVVGPARSRGVVFESRELIQELVSSAEGPGSLPLLQFALAELWERRDQALQRITRAKLEEMGGVAGALSLHADSVLRTLGRGQVDAARQVFLHLVTAVRTRIERAEEELAPASNVRRRSALRALVEGRLLHVRAEEGRAVYQIAHDALIAGWPTLRSWLDEGTALLPIRQRLEAASAEWVRLKHPPDALAGRRLLADARRLDPHSLAPRERLFLDRSWRAERRRRLIRWTAILAPAVVALAVASGTLYQMGRGSREAARAQVELALRKQELARGLAAEAARRREEALVLYDGRAPAGAALAPGDLWQAAEERWAEALESFDQAWAASQEADDLLQRALQRVPDHGDARRALAALLHERLLLAERFHRSASADAARLNQLAALGYRPAEDLSAPATLDLDTDPPGALVEISRLLPGADGARGEAPVPAVGPGPLRTPLRAVSLPAGSYLLHLRHPERPQVSLPMLLSRGRPARLRVPLPGAVPEGYTYIPPGCSLMGSAHVEELRSFLYSPPLREVCLDQGFLIGRTEVTFGDWIAYLEDLAPDRPERRLLSQPRYSVAGAAVTLEPLPRGRWLFSFLRQGAPPLRAATGETFRYPDRPRRDAADWTRFPLVGVSFEDLSGYFFWLDRTGRLPRARLCMEQEWERAARGADDRPYPHGDKLLPDDANIDATYGHKPSAMGLDEVGAHPRSRSPFGLFDMAGNAFELVRSATESLGRAVLRGGAWYYDRTGALVANRQPVDPSLRDVTTGVRVCAPLPSQ